MSTQTKYSPKKPTDDDRFVRVPEVMYMMRCSQSAAYKKIQDLNEELKAKGFMTMQGRVVRSYFEERTGLKVEG